MGPMLRIPNRPPQFDLHLAGRLGSAFGGYQI